MNDIFDQIFEGLCGIFNDPLKTKEFVSAHAAVGCTTEEVTKRLLGATKDFDNKDQIEVKQ